MTSGGSGALVDARLVTGTVGNCRQHLELGASEVGETRRGPAHDLLSLAGDPRTLDRPRDKFRPAVRRVKRRSTSCWRLAPLFGVQLPRVRATPLIETMPPSPRHRYPRVAQLGESWTCLVTRVPRRRYSARPFAWRVWARRPTAPHPEPAGPCVQRMPVDTEGLVAPFRRGTPSAQVRGGPISAEGTRSSDSASRKGSRASARAGLASPGREPL